MKSRLQIKVLGELAVLREGREIVLPASKKTRALLAYLAVTNRRQRRDHLCQMFWEVPDDPRASLRWSLSKLRRAIETDSGGGGFQKNQNNNLLHAQANHPKFVGGGQNTAEKVCNPCTPTPRGV